MNTYKIPLPAGPLWNHQEAREKAPLIAAAHQGQWTGAWSTVIPAKMSLIEIERPVEQKGRRQFLTEVPAGYLASEQQAQTIGPLLAISYGATFTGNWRTLAEEEMSVIEIRYIY
jgi:hypothetical protein